MLFRGHRQGGVNKNLCIRIRGKMEYGSRGFYGRGKLSSDIRERGGKADFAPNILNLLNQHSLSEGRETGFSFPDINTHIRDFPGSCSG